jgi:putative FmdB family regulatory protein
MPVYAYMCEQCQTVFEVLASIREKDAGLEPECPACLGKQTHQLITAGSFLKGGAASGLSLPGCGPNSGPGCCG